MKLHIEKTGEIILVVIKGNIGYEDINLFYDEVSHNIENTFHPRFVFDMAEVPYINSATIGKFVTIFKKITKADGVIKFCNVRPFIKNILDITQLSSVFEIYDSRHKALEAVKKSS
ncbi:MAG: STAS domain-containing protein [Candidatus Muiribacteriota bacterium]